MSRPKREPPTDHTLFRKGNLQQTCLRYVMTENERATKYPIPKLKFISPSAVSPHFERNMTLSPIIVTVLSRKYFQGATPEAVEILLSLHTCVVLWEWKQKKYSTRNR